MKKFIRTIALVITLIYMICVGEGCTNNTAYNANMTVGDLKSEAKKTELSLWSYPNAAIEFDAMIRAFSDKYPNTVIQKETISFERGPEKVDIAIAASSTPDILMDFPGRVLGYAEKGVIQDIDDLLDEIAPHYNAWMLDVYKYVDGKRYGLGLWADLMCGMVNKKIFEAAGAVDLLPSDDTATWTTGEFLKAMEAIRDWPGRPKDVYPLALYAGDRNGDWQMFQVYYGFGGRIFNDDQTKCIINSPENVEALELIISLIGKGFAVPGAATLKEENMFPLFNEGRIAFTFAGYQSSISGIVSKVKSGEITAEVEPVLVTMPHKAGIDTTVFAGPNGYAIFKNDNTDTLHAAKTFLRYCALESEDIIKMIQRLCLIPGRKGVDSLEGLDPVLKKSLDTSRAMMDQYSSAQFFNVPNLNSCRDALSSEIQAAYAKVKTAGEALSDFEKKANALISEVVREQ